jgi:hypothetical protein
MAWLRNYQDSSARLAFPLWIIFRSGGHPSTIGSCGAGHFDRRSEGASGFANSYGGVCFLQTLPPAFLVDKL